MKKIKLTAEEKAELKKLRKANGGLIAEFKTFITKGNVMDMAVGVVVGGAFSKIVSSLVADIITPLISLATGSADFKELKWVITEADLTTGTEAVTVNYGIFIQAVIDFFIIAVCIFAAVKIINGINEKLKAQAAKLKKKEDEEPAPAPAAPTTKKCPYCKSEIAIDATRCPHCTSQLD